MDNKDDIIVQVDESTKELMREVKDGLSSGVTEQIEQIAKETRKDNSDNIDRVLSKLKDFSGMKTSIEELKGLSDDTQQLKDEIVPIAQTLESMKNETSEIIKLKEQLSELDKKIDKLQYCMDIVINLVTPFWKKIFKKQES